MNEIERNERAERSLDHFVYFAKQLYAPLHTIAITLLIMSVFLPIYSHQYHLLVLTM